MEVKLHNADQQLKMQELQIQGREDEVRDIEDLVDDLYLEYRLLEDEQQKSEDEVRRLRSRLVDDGRAHEAFDPSIGARPSVVPESYSDLLDRIDEMQTAGILFTGDAETTLDLERIDTIGKCLPKAWQACLTLVDYVQAKRSGLVENGVHWYLEHGPDGYRAFPVRSHAQGETGETKRRFSGERTFPVPREVNPAGKIVMLSHFKLGRLARHDPRLYYYDDTSNSGNVYIGYIGRHLTNMQT